MSSLPVSHSPLLGIAGFRRFTAQQYHQLVQYGIIEEGEPIELLEGYLVEKSVRNPPHEAGLRRLSIRLPRRLPAGWYLQIQGAIALGESEPEPDGAVLRGDETTCDGRLPNASDFGFIVEIADSSLALDRRDKVRIYSNANIPIYWIVNVSDMQVEVYSDPQPAASPPTYATRTDYRPGQDVPIVLDGMPVGSIAVADLLP